MTFGGATSFSRIKTYKIHVNASITFKVLGEISLYVMAENWKHLKDILEFSSFLLLELKKNLANK